MGKALVVMLVYLEEVILWKNMRLREQVTRINV